jgi:hypothetical protein
VIRFPLHLVFAATIAVFACSSDRPPPGGGDTSDDGAGDLAACNDCNKTMRECIAAGDDLSGINECIQAFAACAVDKTGRGLVCHNDNLCGECLDDCEKEQGQVRTDCLLARSSCIAALLDDTSLAHSCPGADAPTCDDCTEALSTCSGAAQSDSDLRSCLLRFASCYVNVTDQGLACDDPDAPCSECLDDCGPEEDPDRLSCLIVRSECIVGTFGEAGVSEALVAAANHGNCSLTMQ